MSDNNATPVEVLGGLFRMYLHDRDRDNTVSRVIAETHEWEPYTTDIVRRELKEGQTFVDAGSNIGYFSLLASTLVGPSGHVYAFEPWSVNFDVLAQNLQLNGCANVVAKRMPLWSSTGVRMIVEGDNPNRGDINVKPLTEQAEAVSTTLGLPQPRPEDVVTSISLDDLFSPGTVDFVKVDTQSSDGEVLRGGRRLFTESAGAGRTMRLVVETPGGIPEGELGMRLVMKTEDYNYYYVREPGA